MSKEAMKLALDALEVATTPLANDRQEVLRAQAALREALAEQQKQGCEYCNHPLYAGTKCKNCGRVTEQAAIKRDLTPEQPARHQGGRMSNQCGCNHWVKPVCPEKNCPWREWKASQSLAPVQAKPAREWVGLSQSDIDIAFDDTQEGGGFDEFAQAIEAKLKEKNT